MLIVCVFLFLVYFFVDIAWLQWLHFMRPVNSADWGVRWRQNRQRYFIGKLIKIKQPTNNALKSYGIYIFFLIWT